MSKQQDIAKILANLTPEQIEALQGANIAETLAKVADKELKSKTEEARKAAEKQIVDFFAEKAAMQSAPTIPDGCEVRIWAENDQIFVKLATKRKPPSGSSVGKGQAVNVDGTEYSSGMEAVQAIASAKGLTYPSSSFSAPRLLETWKKKGHIQTFERV